MSSPETVVLMPGDPNWPASLKERLATSAPRTLQVLGPPSLLTARKTALFCSGKAPGDAILRAYDAARRMRDEGVTVISGFHSPIELECLRILLRGSQPVIICPARAIDPFRVPPQSRQAFNDGRVLYLSPFCGQPKRVTRESAIRRNEVVAALADQAYVAHAEADGLTDHILKQLVEWKVPIMR